MLFICISETYKTNKRKTLITGLLLSGGVISWIWPDSHLHHQLPRGENHFWALRTGPENLPEPQGEVPGKEHCPGLWVRKGTGGAVQTCRRAPLFTSGVHWRTLPRGESLLKSYICGLHFTNPHHSSLKRCTKSPTKGAEKILCMNESGELQDLLIKIEVSVELGNYTLTTMFRD